MIIVRPLVIAFPRQRIGIVGDLIGSRVCQPETNC
jgi:hypothetical protein